MNIQEDEFEYRFVLKITKSCIFSIEKFERHGNQLLVTETVNLNHREIYHLYKNRYYIAKKCERVESNYDV